MKTIRYILITMGGFLALGPIASCFIANYIADFDGVHISSRGPESIIILGHDFGELIWEMGMSPFLLFLTVPIACVCILLSLLTLSESK